MSETQGARETQRIDVQATRSTIRMDLVEHPSGPSPRALCALSNVDHLREAGEAGEALDTRVTGRIAAFEHVAPDWIALANGIEELMLAIFLWRSGLGHLHVFPPSSAEAERLANLAKLDVVLHPRTARFAVEVDPSEDFSNFVGGAAFIQSPNDPTGTLLGAQDAVRLMRAASLVIVDERHGAYSPRSLLPLAREFDRLVILRTFETWAGLAAFPLAYAIAPPRIVREIARFRPSGRITASGLLAAEACLEDWVRARASVVRIRDERARLFRNLRKLNMVRPYPSHANFVLASVERGDIARFDAELRSRGIALHRPTAKGLESCFRISAVSASATDNLKRALIEIAAEL